ncbi:hypothetical protein PAEPH01_2456 [Pancytospora epiphaga]|nr:hypothetical protein PAEPH01_2456 [Pancytospora epiphaga]
MENDHIHHVNSLQIGAVFRTITELTQAMVTLGRKLGISKEVHYGPYVCMLTCSVSEGRQCDAHLLGVYSQRDGFFHLRRRNVIHRCSPYNARQALEQEISKPRYIRMRVGQITEELIGKGYSVGYRDIYDLLHTGIEMNTKENMGNGIVKVRGNAMACLKCFETELKMLNPSLITRTSEREFFYEHSNYSKLLRPVCELKTFQRVDGFIVIGILYDPNNEPVIQSLLITDTSKIDSLKSFLAYSSSSFYIIELDSEIIETMRSAGVDFFVKTRDVCTYLGDADTGDSIAYKQFLNCNYGDREYLKLEPRYYLRTYCKSRLFGLNNMPPVSFEFINPDSLSLSFFDCLSFLTTSISVYMTSKRTTAYELPDSLISDYAVEYMDELMRMPVMRDDWVQACDPTICFCPCGKFQEQLIPCVHAIHKLAKLGVEPYLYVSSIYARDRLLKLPPLVPVINLPTGYNVPNFRRGLYMETGAVSNDNNSELTVEI